MTNERDNRDQVRKIADELIDYAIFAPLGAAVTLAEAFPKLVRLGKERFGTQIKLAQVIGKVAVDSARRQAQGFARPPGRETRQPAQQAQSPVNEPSASRAPFPGYDDLGAAEVVGRLSSLSPAELRRVRSYEEKHRARRTVLGKITQLLDGRG